MPSSGKERRRFSRYDTDVKLNFRVSFDIHTRIDFHVQGPHRGATPSQRHSAVSRNISVEGLCFVSSCKLVKGDWLVMDVFIPSSSEPVTMEGEVFWCRPSAEPEGEYPYETGVKLSSVDGNSVERSIFVDPVHNVVWSIVLESVFGTFKHMILKRPKDAGARED